MFVYQMVNYGLGFDLRLLTDVRIERKREVTCQGIQMTWNGMKWLRAFSLPGL